MTILKTRRSKDDEIWETVPSVISGLVNPLYKQLFCLSIQGGCMQGCIHPPFNAKTTCREIYLLRQINGAIS